MQIDNPRVRQQHVCPLCHGSKDHGLVACWPCYRGHAMKYGNAEAEEIIADFEAALCPKTYAVFKDYYTEHGDHCTDTWVIIYSTQAEAEAAMRKLEAGQDKSWFDPADEKAAAVLYVDRLYF